MPEETDRDLGFIKRLAGLFAKQPRQVAQKTTEPKPKRSFTDSIGSWRELSSWYSDALTNPTLRKAKYQLYKFLDENLAEASTALNVYADTVVSGTVGGEDNYSVYVEDGTKNKEAIEKIIKDFEKRTEIKDQVWSIVRDTMRDGDCFEEVVIEQVADEVRIAKFKDLPTEEMFVDVDDKGVLKNPEIPYYQVPASWDTTEKKISFEDWRCIHFKMDRRAYGVDRSLFANASKRIGKQLIMIDDALVIARLTRATQRYVFMVDVKGVPPDEQFEYVQKYMNRIKTKEIVDRTKGRINVADAPWATEDDIGIPTEPGVNQDVRAIGGDPNLGQITDVTYLRDKFFGVLTIPKAYASIEEGTRSKATLQQIDVQFARQCRRKQAALTPGLKKVYELEFTLRGIDHNSFEWNIEWPELGTTDEAAKWATMAVKVGVANVLVTQIGCVNTDWILTEILGFDEEEIKKYGVAQQDQNEPPVDQGNGFDQYGNPVKPQPEQPPIQPQPLKQQRIYLSPDLKRKLLADPFLRQSLEELKDIVQSRIDREKRIEGKVPVGIKRVESLLDKRI